MYEIACTRCRGHCRYYLGQRWPHGLRGSKAGDRCEVAGCAARADAERAERERRRGTVPELALDPVPCVERGSAGRAACGSPQLKKHQARLVWLAGSSGGRAAGHRHNRTLVLDGIYDPRPNRTTSRAITHRALPSVSTPYTTLLLATTRLLEIPIHHSYGIIQPRRSSHCRVVEVSASRISWLFVGYHVSARHHHTLTHSWGCEAELDGLSRADVHLRSSITVRHAVCGSCRSSG